MKNWIKTMLFVSVLCLAACSDDPDVAPLKRDTDAVELAYNSGATTQISVRYAKVKLIHVLGHLALLHSMNVIMQKKM